MGLFNSSRRHSFHKFILGTLTGERHTHAPHGSFAEQMTFIPMHAAITGNALQLIAPGAIQIDGDVQGDVVAREIVLGRDSCVAGAMQADRITIETRHDDAKRLLHEFLSRSHLRDYGAVPTLNTPRDHQGYDAPPSHVMRSPSTVISQGGSVSGTSVRIKAPGKLEIHGHLQGDAFADEIFISQHGSVDGDLHAMRVSIDGSLNGSLTAEDVTLGSTCHVAGDMYYQDLVLEQGAMFEGKSRRYCPSMHLDAFASRHTPALHAAGAHFTPAS